MTIIVVKIVVAILLFNVATGLWFIANRALEDSARSRAERVAAPRRRPERRRSGSNSRYGVLP